jgi:hypothetical protein
MVDFLKLRNVKLSLFPLGLYNEEFSITKFFTHTPRKIFCGMAMFGLLSSFFPPLKSTPRLSLYQDVNQFSNLKTNYKYVRIP